MKSLQLHKLRFLPYSPSSITSMATSESSLLAVLRSDCIQVYRDTVLLTSVPGSFDFCAFNSDDTLVSAQGDTLQIWDLNAQKTTLVKSNGGIIWSLKVWYGIAVIGCNDSTLKLIDLQTQECKSVHIHGKVTALHLSSSLICTGTANGSLALYNWDLRCLWKVKLGRGEVPTVIWDVLQLNDNVIVADSRGHISIFDTKHGILQKSVKKERGDVLSLAKTESGFAAGNIDGTIAEFTLFEDEYKETRMRRHASDVSALAYYKKKLVCASTCGEILRINRGVERDCLFENESVLIKDRRVYWKIGEKVRVYELEGKHIVDLVFKERVLSFDVQKDLIAIASMEGLRLFTLAHGAVKKQKTFIGVGCGATHVKFEADTLICAGVDGKLHIIDISKNTVSATIQGNGAVRMLRVFGNWAVVSFCFGSVVAFDLEANSEHARLPEFKSVIVALEFDPFNSDIVCLALADNSIYFYNVAALDFTSWSRCNMEMPQKFVERKELIRGITFVKKDAVLVFGHTYYANLDLTKDLNGKRSVQKRRDDGQVIKIKDNGDKKSMVVSHRFKSLMHLQMMDGDIVAIERPVLSMLENASGYKKKTFGS